MAHGSSADATWRGGLARMRRDDEAMWQGRASPTRGAGGADTWQEATRVHADAREERHVAGGLAVGGPTGQWALVIGLGQ